MRVSSSTMVSSICFNIHMDYPVWICNWTLQVRNISFRWCCHLLGKTSTTAGNLSNVCALVKEN